MFTMFICETSADQADMFTCLGSQNYGVAFTLLAGNPHLVIYGWDLQNNWWVEFNPMDCPAVECGELPPMAVLKDKKAIAALDHELSQWLASAC